LIFLANCFELNDIPTLSLKLLREIFIPSSNHFI
jgi:hypothetical protein